MILMDMKKETASSSTSPLNLSTSSEKPDLSFSDLLRGVSEDKDDKLIQNGSLILSLESDEKSTKDVKSTKTSKVDSLLSLLKNEDALELQIKEEPLELNPKLTATLTTQEIKTLVSEAKNYLKDKILESDDYKLSLVKDLPKTLKGLVKVAKTLGIEISKISVEEVKAHSGLKQAKEIIKQEDVKTLTLKSDDKKAAVQDVEETVQDKKVVTKVLKEVLADTKVITKDLKAALADTKVSVKDLKEELHVDKKVSAPELKEELHADKKAVVTNTKELHVDKKAVVHKELHVDNNDKSQAAKTAPIAQNEKIQEIKATPLFKAQAAIEHTTTEQIVQVKANSSLLKVETKTPKQKADETLMLLLRGEKPTISNPVLTADFSVATAKVIAPNATSNISKSLENLLHGDTSSSENSSSPIKSDALSTNKADSFEVKLNEAKQMIKYLSNDVKTAIEDYKSPFTRVKVQLNPQKLGEVDVTIVQRGKNLHVSISSNNTAINTLSMNANELRVQLSNSGINNATLNFNNSSQNSDSSASNQQQSRQNEKKAGEEYSYFENEEENEEILSSLEIIVPQYV